MTVIEIVAIKLLEINGHLPLWGNFRYGGRKDGDPLGNTVIHYFLPEGSGNARLEVRSVDGKLLTTLPLAQTGEGQVQLWAGRFPAGTYNDTYHKNLQN